MNTREASNVCEYKNYSVELICFPGRRSHKPLRNWKKSQKKIRREKRQRGVKA